MLNESGLVSASENTLPEHAAPERRADGPESIPPEEQEAIKLANKIFDKAKRSRSKKDREWVTYIRYFRGDQWKQKRPSYRHSEVINLVTSNIRNVLPILTDSQPQVQTTPEEPSDYEFSEIINEVISGKWDRENFNQILAECMIDAMVIGTGIGHVPWVDSAADGLGDYDFETTDPTHIYPHPSARNVNDRRSRSFCVAEPVDLEELREEFGDRAKDVKPDMGDVTSFNSYGDEAENFQFKSPTDNRMTSQETRAAGNGGNPDLVLKISVFIKSGETCEESDDRVDEATGEKVTTTHLRKKYPNGRLIVIAGGKLMRDGAMEYDDGKFPYARLVNDIVPREFFGDGEIFLQKSPQDIINKLWSYFMDYLIIMGNPHWVIDDEAQVDTDTVTNEPGMILVKKKEGTAVQQPGLSPPPFLLNALEFAMSQMMSKVSGQDQISQGFLSKSNLSGDAIAQLTEASQTRLRAKARNIDAFLNDIGQMFLSRILQGYTLPRIQRINGQNGEDAKYFKFHVERTTAQVGGQPVLNDDGSPKTQLVATYSKYNPGDHAAGIPGTFETPRQIPLKGNLDVRITTGTSLPFLKAKKEQQAERFFDKGILDAEDLLDLVDYPNREKYIAKWKARQASQTSASAGGAGPGGGKPA